MKKPQPVWLVWLPNGIIIGATSRKKALAYRVPVVSGGLKPWLGPVCYVPAPKPKRKGKSK